MARVAIVVDREFGERLAELAGRMPVWIGDTPTNRPWIDAHWALTEGDVTRFAVGFEDGPETMAMDILPTVDLHHGKSSEDLPWTELTFFGIEPTSALREALAEHGVGGFRATADGFIATRTLG